MLRSQLSRAFLVSNSLLFITPPATSPPNFNEAGNITSNTVKVSPKVSETNNVVLNKQAKVYVKKYIQKNNRRLFSIKQRNKSRFLLIDSVFSRHGLPVELKYLAVVESEMKPTALSRVGARGPWQFMPRTARILGLKVSRSKDERTHYPKSTRAAAIYLKDLYREFGDWLLVLAAYNGGPAPVYRAIRKAHSRNFWELQAYLPAESRAHVKKYIATHYYFEGRGSMTTLTKSERLEYAKAMAAVARK